MYSLKLVNLYLLIGIVIAMSNKNLPSAYVGLLLFFMFKMIFNYRKCTISYIECKIRKIKKEQGFVYNALDEIYNLNQSRYKYFIISFILFIILLNLKKCIYN